MPKKQQKKNKKTEEINLIIKTKQTQIIESDIIINKVLNSFDLIIQEGSLNKIISTLLGFLSVNFDKIPSVVVQQCRSFFFAVVKCNISYDLVFQQLNLYHQKSQCKNFIFY